MKLLIKNNININIKDVIKHCIIDLLFDYIIENNK
jgi:hypothetical protein